MGQYWQLYVCRIDTRLYDVADSVTRLAQLQRQQTRASGPGGWAQARIYPLQ